MQQKRVPSVGKNEVVPVKKKVETDRPEELYTSYGVYGISKDGKGPPSVRRREQDGERQGETSMDTHMMKMRAHNKTTHQKKLEGEATQRP